tara:strand:+ start:64 stop:363 length:300 start_codon:yes stop_codon:yes gene_type:complete
MANYIRIKKENINITGADSDILIGDITGVYAGTLTGLASANDVYVNVGMDQYKLKVTAAAADWSKDIQRALTANPGGMVANVTPTSAVKVTDYVPTKQL